jgi:hypothetical protein
MGVISITRRSETLGNIGGTSMAHGVTDTDAGSARSGAYARTFSPHYYAKHEWSGDDGIAKGIGGFAAVAAGISIREDERESDELVRKTIDQLDRIDRDERVFTSDELGDDSQYRYLLGDADADGNYVNAQKRGLRLRTGAGTRRLVEETDQTFADTFTKVAEEMGASDKAKKNARERLFNYQQGRVKYAFDTQASEYRKMEVQGAKDQLTAFTSAYLSGNEDVLGDVFEAREKLGILEGKTDEQRRLDATTLAQGIATATFENWEAETANSADPDAVKAAWEERRKSFVTEDGKKPEDPLLATAYDNGLDKDGEKKVLAAFDKCAKRSVATARYNKVRRDEQVRDGLVAKEAALFKTQVDPKDSGAVMADMEQKSIQYKDLGEEAERSGTHQLALAYFKTSQSLKNGKARAEDEQTRAACKAEYDLASANFDAGGFYDENGEWQEMSLWQQHDYARLLLAQNRITYSQYSSLMTKTRPQLNELGIAFRSYVLGELTKIVPNAIKYDKSIHQYKVSASKDVRESTPTKYAWKSDDETGSEIVTYKQLVDTMNLILAQADKEKMSLDTMKQTFDNYATNAKRSRDNLTVQERLDYDKKSVEDFQEARRAKIRSMRRAK